MTEAQLIRTGWALWHKTLWRTYVPAEDFIVTYRPDGHGTMRPTYTKPFRTIDDLRAE